MSVSIIIVYLVFCWRTEYSPNKRCFPLVHRCPARQTLRTRKLAVGCVLERNNLL